MEEGFSSIFSEGEMMETQQDGVVIRTAERFDAQQLVTWWNDGAVMAHAGFPYGLHTTEEKVIAVMCEGRCMTEYDGRRIGECCWRDRGNHTAEIGIKICETDDQKHGISRKVLTILIDLVFQNDFELIVLDTDVNNTRARHVYESLGFQLIKINENSWQDQTGVYRSSVDYQLKECDFRPYPFELEQQKDH